MLTIQEVAEKSGFTYADIRAYLYWYLGDMEWLRKTIAEFPSLYIRKIPQCSRKGVLAHPNDQRLYMMGHEVIKSVGGGWEKGKWVIQVERGEGQYKGGVPRLTKVKAVELKPFVSIPPTYWLTKTQLRAIQEEDDE